LDGLVEQVDFGSSSQNQVTANNQKNAIMFSEYKDSPERKPNYNMRDANDRYGSH